MKIIELATESLVPYENNPRNNDQAVDAVAASIKEFGFKVPIIIDEYGLIIAGHTRLKAAKKLGLETVPCIRADDLTDEQARAFRLADNKTAELASWKIDKLEQELKGISMDMERFGFGDEPEKEEQGKEAKSSNIVTFSFQLHEQQKSLIEKALQEIGSNTPETFGNTNKNGNAIYEVVRQWIRNKQSL